MSTDDESAERPRTRSRLVPRICWAVSGLSLLFALGWIALHEDKSIGIFLGIVAMVVTRVLVGDVARWHEEAAARDLAVRRREHTDE